MLEATAASSQSMAVDDAAEQREELRLFLTEHAADDQLPALLAGGVSSLEALAGADLKLLGAHIKVGVKMRLRHALQALGSLTLAPTREAHDSAGSVSSGTAACSASAAVVWEP